VVSAAGHLQIQRNLASENQHEAVILSLFPKQNRAGGKAMAAGGRSKLGDDRLGQRCREMQLRKDFEERLLIH
jgi:hypothetical protein